MCRTTFPTAITATSQWLVCFENFLFLFSLCGWWSETNAVISGFSLPFIFFLSRLCGGNIYLDEAWIILLPESAESMDAGSFCSWDDSFEAAASIGPFGWWRCSGVIMDSSALTLNPSGGEARGAVEVIMEEWPEVDGMAGLLQKNGGADPGGWWW